MFKIWEYCTTTRWENLKNNYNILIIFNLISNLGLSFIITQIQPKIIAEMFMQK